MGRSLLQSTATCSTGGSSSHGGAAAWRSAPCGTHGLQGDSLLHRGPLHRPQGNVPGAPPALLLHSPWGLQGYFLLLSLLAAVPQHFFSPFLKHILTDVQTISLTSLQPHLLACLWPATGLLSNKGQLLDSSRRSHPCGPPLPKPSHVNPLKTLGMMGMWLNKKGVVALSLFALVGCCSLLSDINNIFENLYIVAVVH